MNKIILLLILATSSFAQTGRERVADTKPTYKVTSIQTIDDVVMFDYESTKDATTNIALVVANCTTGVGTIVAFRLDNKFYRITAKPIKPEKDSPLELGILEACKDIKTY